MSMGRDENEKIKELALKQINLQTQCQALYDQQPQVADSLVDVLMQAYKKDVSHNYIFKEPMKLIATSHSSNILL